jgi:dethiobiotin synthetase
MSRRIFFITGTGTGVGKTVLTALLLGHLRQEGGRALAMKPFCSGSCADARLLWRLQKEALTLDQTNPFFFSRPLAPWVDAKLKHAPQIPLSNVLRKIRALGRRAGTLLVEGSGGVLVPLGEGYSVADLIVGTGKMMAKTECASVIVAPNSLGTINHTLLTVRHLQSIGVTGLVIVLMGQRRPDLSSRSNFDAIRELIPEVPVYLLPYLGDRASDVTVVRQNAKYLKKTLALLLRGAKVATVPSDGKGDVQQKPLTARR